MILRARVKAKYRTFAFLCVIAWTETSCYFSHRPREHKDDASESSDGDCRLDADNGCESGAETSLGRRDASADVSVDGTNLVIEECPEGSWHDTEHHLCWENPQSLQAEFIDEAEAHCDNLSLDGLEWRIPTIDELRSVIRGCPFTELGGPCDNTFMNDYCVGCQLLLGPDQRGCYGVAELNGDCYFFWSSSFENARDVSPDSYRFWVVNFSTAAVSLQLDVVGYYYVRCVRDGP